MPRQGAASGHHGESPDCCIACFRRQRQADSLIPANMVASAFGAAHRPATSALVAQLSLVDLVLASRPMAERMRYRIAA
jgi:hypothetical protein